MEKLKKVSLAHCKKVLESTGRKYTEEQIERIRDILYQLGEMDYRIFKELPKSNLDDPEEIKAA